MSQTPCKPDVQLEMYSQARLLAPARAMVASIAQRIGFNEVDAGQISLALDEALSNIINHGYEGRPDGRICVSVCDERSPDPPGIRIVIEDRARQVDPEVIRPRDLDDIRPGGLGVFIIQEIMDDVTYEKREGGGMRLTLVKRMGNEGGPAEPA